MEKSHEFRVMLILLVKQKFDYDIKMSYLDTYLHRGFMQDMLTTHLEIKFNISKEKIRNDGQIFVFTTDNLMIYRKTKSYNIFGKEFLLKFL